MLILGCRLYLKKMIMIDWNVVLRAIQADVTKDWERCYNGSIDKFKESNMNSNAKALNWFISASLCPTNNTSDVIQMHCSLISQTLSGKAFDIGAYIHQAIKAMIAQKCKTTSLFFPQLIIELCIAAGVEFETSEQDIEPKPMIKLSNTFLQEGSHQPVAF